MEVHHPHHPTHKKNWKEYIVEFLMLFAAVTLGFFAENIREHQIIDNHKIQNLIAMVNDLQQDSIEIKKRISEYSKAVKQFEKIKDLSLAYHQKQITENELIDSVVSEYLNTKWSIGLFINNASYKSTISAGSLGYIQNNETKQLIAQYYEVLYGKLLVNNTILDNDASEFTGKTFIFGYMQKSNEKLEGQTRTNDEQIEEFKSIPAFRKLILAPEFRMSVNKIEGRCGYYLFVMEMAKDLNNRLLSKLNNREY